MKKLFQNKKSKYTIIGIITVIVICLGVTYAYWLLTKEQTNKNIVKSACLKVDFSGEDDITLDDAYPLEEDALEYFLTNQTPYHFTITNKCNNLQNAVINLETLNVSNTLLEDDYVDVLLYENDYHEKLNKANKLTGNTINDSNKVIKDARHAYALYQFTLKNNETREFNLQLYLDKDTPMNESTMNASWKGKITLSTEYTNDKFINAGTLRTISFSDKEGMWKYKSNIKQIVIEDNKNRKTSNDGVVYGPFDESEKQDNSVQSYVVCESGDINCIGYLQGDGGIKANPNSSNLFSGYSNLTDIIGLDKLNTSETTNMGSMFSSCRALTSLDLSSFDTRKVTNMSGIFGGATFSTLNLSNWDLSNLSPSSSASMFGGNTNLITLDMTNVVFPPNSSNFFAAGLTGLKNLILEGSDTSHVTNMDGMFQSCSNLKILDLSMWDTSHVTTVENMFAQVPNITELNLSNWDLSSLTSSPSMFYGNSLITKIDMTNAIFPVNSNWFFSAGLTSLNTIILDNVDTSHTTSMSSMFSGCSSLTSLDLSSFDTANVISIGNMFGSMDDLSELNLSNWTFNDSISPSFIVSSSIGSNNLDKLILDNVNTSQVTNMSNMFGKGFSIPLLDLSSFDTSNVTNMSNMFEGISGVQSLDLSNFNTKQVTKVNEMLNGANTITYLDLSNWDLSGLSSYPNMFSGNRNLATINMTNFIFPQDCSNFFEYMTIENLDLTNSDTSHTTNMYQMFYGAANLISLDLSSWDTSHVNDVTKIFDGLIILTELNLSDWDLSNVSHNFLNGFLSSCNSLSTLNMTNFVFPPNSNKFFTGGLGVQNIILTGSDISHVTSMDYMFLANSNITNLDLSSWDTSHITSMDGVFNGMSNLQEINLKGWNTSNVNSMYRLFAGDENLQSLDLSGFDTHNVLNYDEMFSGTSKLETITYGNNFVHNEEATTSKMFYNSLLQERPPHSSWQDVSFE